jgi:alpha-mannosidase
MSNTGIFSVRHTDFRFLSACNIFLVCLALALVSTDAKGQPEFDRDWKIFLVPFSHIDVGFTDPVPIVLENQHEYLDSVLSYFSRQATEGESIPFRWTIEIPWILESYIETRSPDRVDYLMDRIASGEIELGAMHFGLQTDLCGPEELIRSLYYAQELHRTYGIPIRTAIINDTPGFTWSLAQILPASGIPYLSVAMNSVLSEFFTTTTQPYLFYWEAQNGDHVLVWRSIDENWAYLEGAITYNVYGSYIAMNQALTRLLTDLQQSGYPYDAVVLNCATGDNGPPRFEILENARLWNQSHDRAEIFISTFSDFFGYMQTEFSGDIPVYSGDAPNWWSWLFATSASEGFETSRRVQRKLPVAETFAAIADASRGDFVYPASRLRRAYVENLLYEDHNMGGLTNAANIEFWERKMDWINSAEQAADEVLSDAIASLTTDLGHPEYVTLTVFNGTDRLRSDYVKVNMAGHNIPDPVSHALIDAATGDNIHTQITFDGSFVFMAEEVPAYGYKIFHFLPGPVIEIANGEIHGSVIENRHYRLTLDMNTGSVIGLYDKESEKELTRQDGRFNRFLYNSTYPPSGMTVEGSDSGSVFQRIVLQGEAQGTGSYRTEVILLNDLKRIDFINSYDKSPPASFEAIDFVFDLAIDDPRLSYEIPYGNVRLFDDELSGFRSNHYAMQRWMRVSSETSPETVVIASDAVATHAYQGGQFDGRIRFIASFNTAASAYRAGIGEHTTAFSVTSGTDSLDAAAAASFAYDFNNRLIPVLLPPETGAVEGVSSFSFLSVEPPDLQITTIKQAEDGNGYIIRLFNPLPDRIDASLEFGRTVSGGYITSAVEENRNSISVNENSISLSVGGFDITTIRVLIQKPVSVRKDSNYPLSFSVYQNYPNPFNASTVIRYRLHAEATVKLTVYNILGQRIASLVDGEVGRGEHEVVWDGRNSNGSPVPSGIYFYEFNAAPYGQQIYREVKSMTIIK